MKTATMETVIRNHLQNTLELFNWNKTLAGRALDLDRRTVYRMIQRFRLEPLGPESDPLAPVFLRCNECGAVSEPGEVDPAVLHTHSCPLGEAVQ